MVLMLCWYHLRGCFLSTLPEFCAPTAAAGMTSQKVAATSQTAGEAGPASGGGGSRRTCPGAGRARPTATSPPCGRASFSPPLAPPGVGHPAAESSPSCATSWGATLRGTLPSGGGGLEAGGTKEGSSG